MSITWTPTVVEIMDRFPKIAQKAIILHTFGVQVIVWEILTVSRVAPLEEFWIFCPHPRALIRPSWKLLLLLATGLGFKVLGVSKPRSSSSGF